MDWLWLETETERGNLNMREKITALLVHFLAQNFNY